MYDDIVDYDDFSERVGSENDILDLIYDEIWKKTYCPKCKRFNTHSRSKYALKNILCLIAVHSGLPCKRQYFSRHASI